MRPRAVSWASLRALLPPGTKSTRAGDAVLQFVLERRASRYVTKVGDELVSDAMSLAAARDLLEGQIALQVAARSPEHVFIHAGVVVWRGLALLLPGRSMAGKSTLVRFLVRNGAHYYSDEYAVLNEAGQVLPYPRRLSLRRARGAPRKIALPIPRRVARRVGWVIGARYMTSEKSRFELRPLSAGQTALLLLDNAVAARVSPARVLSTVRAVASVSVGMTGTRGDAELAAKTLLAHCKPRGRVIRETRNSRRT